MHKMMSSFTSQLQISSMKPFAYFASRHFGRIIFLILIDSIYLFNIWQFMINTEHDKRENISQAYLRILKQLSKDTQKAYNDIFSKIEALIPSMNIGDQLEEFSKKQESMLWYQQRLKTSLNYVKDMNKYQIGIKFIYWLLLRTNKTKDVRLTELPSIIEEVVNLIEKQKYPNEIIPYIYIILSSFIEIFVKFQQMNCIKNRIKIGVNPKYLCFPINFRQIQSVYTSRQQFWAFLRQKPMLKFSNFVCDQNYEVYNQNFMADISDKHCILSTNLINPASFPLLQRFIISKFITLNIDKNIKIITNNYFLNKFQQLTLQKLLAKDEINKQMVSKEFCLTVSINYKTLSKIMSFFNLMPPQLSPLSKYSIFAYQSNNFTNIFFRIATECYWQYCPKSQFTEVYFLSNQSKVQWLCIPSNIYKELNGRFSSWSQDQFEYIYGQTSQTYRGLQHKGQLVIIQNGFDYFWKVKFGSAAFIKWSLLIKQPQAIESYTDIITQYQNDDLNRTWRIEFPHRSMIINYLSHQWMRLQTPALRKLIDFVIIRLQLQQSKYVSLLEKGSGNAELKQLMIEKSLRLCGYCGQQILNYFLLANKQVYCLDCILSIPTGKQYQGIKYCYIHKPDKLRTFFNSLMLAKQNLSASIALEEFALPQMLSLTEVYYQTIEIKNNCSGIEKILQKQPIINQFNFKSQDLSLLLFQKRSSFFSPQPLFKHLVLKTIQSEAQSSQMSQLLKIIVKLFLDKDEKRSLQTQISQFYQQSNYVLEGLNMLRNSQR